MRQFVLIGKSLSHSFSKVYFEEKFRHENITDTTYDLFEISDIQNIKSFIKAHPDLVGFNVTIPYKQSIIPYLDELSEAAKAVGAVNTVAIQRINGQLFTKGYNTDIIGFRQSLEGVTLPEKALVLGTGGAAAAVTYVLEQLGCQCCAVSRDAQRGLPYPSLTVEMVRDYRFIVNCTPLGTYPDINKKPDIPYDGISGNHFLYDLVYNPAETAFLKEGLLRGAKVENGEKMLHGQAEAAWRIWS